MAMRTTMRRVAPLVLVACLLLTACTGQKKIVEFVPATAVTALQDSGAFEQALEEMDKETASLYYGLDEASIQECAVYGSLSAGAEEIAVLVLNSSEEAATAKQALEIHLEDQKEALRDYQPEEVAKVEGAVLEQRGTSVLLAVATDGEKARSTVEGLR